MSEACPEITEDISEKSNVQQTSTTSTTPVKAEGDEDKDSPASSDIREAEDMLPRIAVLLQLA